MEEIQGLLARGDIGTVKEKFSEIFRGVPYGKNAEPGMMGSLLYHMAMVTKMETESTILLNELNVDMPSVDKDLERFQTDFAIDATSLLQKSGLLDYNSQVFSYSGSLNSEDKVDLFKKLDKKTQSVEKMLGYDSIIFEEELEGLFREWAQHVTKMRLRQEYETIKGLLVTLELEKKFGPEQLEKTMTRVEKRFGHETVDIALQVTLKVGLRREKLQSIMLSDHHIDYKMSIASLDGSMKFQNCPIFGSHKYITTALGVDQTVCNLFCKHFCFAHASAMLETVLPFTFALSHPQRMATHGLCEFYMQLGNAPGKSIKRQFIPLIVSWNVTRKCNLKCSHCYINATKNELKNELTTGEGKNLIDQIASVSKPMLILSGGEPLLRGDLFELIRYGTQKGLRMALGSNGYLLDKEMAYQLEGAGIKTASISLDSSSPNLHDTFRGVQGSWSKAIEAIKALKETNIIVQVNTTLTKQNYDDIDNIMSLIENLGVENFHLFFLVPTGRGVKVADISPKMYEDMIKTTFAKTFKHTLNVRPSCAPQFMRIAKDKGIDMKQWIRGCIAGLYYCRVYPNGDVTPCPYLPINLGNIRATSFKEIWHNSSVLTNLRNFNTLKGKCGKCSYRQTCGGCRARAYGLSEDFIDFCGDLHEPAITKADYLAEDPWCIYQPSGTSKEQALL
jgi:radical SAM protein with 4Fe4S-binding SPASM domain